MHPLAAQAFVALGSIVDIALGLAVCFRSTAARAMQGMLLVSAVYLVAGTALRPDLWADPLGPFVKTVPAAVLALAALALLDER
ncbi:MAG: DoxX-like family protein [Caulobacteraceae bacterium]|nr:DoxX-like family protein [Caulobacteraceae bacterium]